MAARGQILAAYDALNPVAFGELATRAGGTVSERDGVLLARGPEPAGIIVNGAFRRVPRTPPARVLELARDHFADGFGFTLWAPVHSDADIDAAAMAAGWRMIVELPVLDPPVALASAEHSARTRSAVKDGPVPGSSACRPST